MRPLNGEHTHALSDFARGELTRIQASPQPIQSLNPGVRNRLERERLVEIVMLPSPYKTHKAKPIAHYKITEVGALELNKGKQLTARKFPWHLRAALTATTKRK